VASKSFRLFLFFFLIKRNSRTRSAHRNCLKFSAPARLDLAFLELTWLESCSAERSRLSIARRWKMSQIFHWQVPGRRFVLPFPRYRNYHSKLIYLINYIFTSSYCCALPLSYYCSVLFVGKHRFCTNNNPIVNPSIHHICNPNTPNNMANLFILIKPERELNKKCKQKCQTKRTRLLF